MRSRSLPFERFRQFLSTMINSKKKTGVFEKFIVFSDLKIGLNFLRFWIKCPETSIDLFYLHLKTFWGCDAGLKLPGAKLWCQLLTTALWFWQSIFFLDWKREKTRCNFGRLSDLYCVKRRPWHFFFLCKRTIW